MTMRDYTSIWPSRRRLLVAGVLLAVAVIRWAAELRTQSVVMAVLFAIAVLMPRDPVFNPRALNRFVVSAFLFGAVVCLATWLLLGFDAAYWSVAVSWAVVIVIQACGIVVRRLPARRLTDLSRL